MDLPEVDILKFTDENSRIRIHQSEVWIRGSGSISQRYGSADPDPYKNFMVGDRSKEVADTLQSAKKTKLFIFLSWVCHQHCFGSRSAIGKAETRSGFLLKMQIQASRNLFWALIQNYRLQRSPRGAVFLLFSELTEKVRIPF